LQSEIKDYFGVFQNFIKKSLKLNDILSNEDMYVKMDDYILNKRLLISKFYSTVIIKIILRDLKDIIVNNI
jgi:hypothetical protein